MRRRSAFAIGLSTAVKCLMCFLCGVNSVQGSVIIVRLSYNSCSECEIQTYLRGATTKSSRAKCFCCGTNIDEYSYDAVFNHIPPSGIVGHLFLPTPVNPCSYVDPPPRRFRGNSTWIALIDDYPLCPSDMVRNVQNAGYRLIIVSSTTISHRTVSKEVSNTPFPIVVIKKKYAIDLKKTVRFLPNDILVHVFLPTEHGEESTNESTTKHGEESTNEHGESTNEHGEESTNEHGESNNEHGEESTNEHGEESTMYPIILSLIAILGCVCYIIYLCYRHPYWEQTRHFEPLLVHERQGRREPTESIQRQIQDSQLDLRRHIPVDRQLRERTRDFEPPTVHEGQGRRELTESIQQYIHDPQFGSIPLDRKLLDTLHYIHNLGRPDPQLAQRLPMRKYNANSETTKKCGICGNEFTEEDEVRVLPCDHIFHPQCIDEWLGKHSSLCPLCKKRVPRVLPPLERSEGRNVFEETFDSLDLD